MMRYLTCGELEGPGRVGTRCASERNSGPLFDPFDSSWQRVVLDADLYILDINSHRTYSLVFTQEDSFSSSLDPSALLIHSTACQRKAKDDAERQYYMRVLETNLCCAK